jgi:hypothetical protein
MIGAHVEALLEAAARMSDEDVDELAEQIDDELVGGDPRPTLIALRELGQGNDGTPPADLDPLD